MRRMMFAAVAFALVLGLSGTAHAVEIHNLSGQSCGDFSGTWHFVLNGAPAGVAQQLTATWSSDDVCGPVGPSKTNGSKTTQHFNCTASGTLESAFTSGNGRLQLSDFKCETKCEKNCEPPKK